MTRIVLHPVVRLSAALLWLVSPVSAEKASVKTSARTDTVAAGRLLVETLHSPSLENTVTGEDPERTVAVYLPPSYDTSPEKRYPMLLLLHGIEDTETEWTRAWYDTEDPWGTLERLMNRGVAAGRLQEMIVVMPDQKTKAGGSMYSNSSVTGRWEDFTVSDLVRWADGRFRTLARAESRGITGHSMGGYGAIMLGMKRPDVFSVVYAMNPALLGWAGDLSLGNPAFRTVLDRRGWDDFEHFYEAALVCVAQAFSPNPERGPFYVDFPFKVEGGELVPDGDAFASWEARMPIHIAELYRENLLQLRGLRFDSGTEDEFTHIPVTSRQLSRVLTELEVPHIFEEYNGDHRNRMWGRTGRLYTEVLPWFSLLLESDPGAR